MSVSVSNGSLDFVSTLDNSDFQAKSLQDLKLIELRLQLTGDTSGVTKYDEAVKAALETETKLRADLAKILEDAQIQTQQFIRTVQQPGNSKTVFSDSEAEVKAYQDSLQSFADTGNVALSGVDALLQSLNADFASGAISAEQYKEAIDAMTEAQTFFNQQVAASNTASEEEVGILQSLKTTIAELKAEQLLITNPEELAASNLLLQEYETELKAAQNAGRIGFDELGQKIVQTNAEIEEAVGLLGTLQAELKTLQASRINLIDPGQLSAANAQIQQLEGQIKQLSNQGKEGFDELGNALPVEQVGKFEAAVSRVTNVQNIGARVVSQFSRQIISLGVGFLSLEIGAKAIQSLIEYISNLDIFTGRLDVAKQTLLAWDDVLKQGADDAAKNVVSLQIYVDVLKDTNSSLQERITAGEQLKALLPDETKNVSALAIANGALKNSYDDLTASILKQATVQAALSKIQDLEKQKLEIQEQQAAIQFKADQDKAAATGYAASTSFSGPGSSTYTPAISKAENQAGIQQFADQQKAKLQPGIDVLNQTINNIVKVAGGAQVLAGQLDGTSNKLKVSLQNFASVLAASTSKADFERLQKSLQDTINNPAGISDSDLEKYKKDLQEVEDIIKQRFTVKPTSTKIDPAIAQGQSLLAQQTTLLQNVDALKAKYAAKDDDRDQQAVDALKASFQKQYDAIVAFNVKRQDFIDKYNKTHKGGGGEAYANSIGLKQQDTGQLQPAETAALAGLSGEQSLEKTKNTIEQQKVLFQAYEDFKLKAGTDAANKLFANDLGGYTSYLAYLKSLQPSEADLTSADPYTKARANALSDYLKTELPKAQADELKLTQKHLQDLIIQDQDWQQQRLTLIATSNDNIKTLQAAGFTEQAKQAADNLKQQLTTLEENGFEQQAAYKKLFSNVTELSTEAAQSQIKNAQALADALHAAGILNDDAYKKITDDLTKLKAVVADRQFENLAAIGAGLSSIGTAFEGINSGFASYISNLGSLVTSLGKVGTQYEQIGKDAGDAAKQQQDEINLAATGVSALVSLISVVTSASAARKKAAEDYYNSVIAFQQQYNVALDQQLQLQYQTQGNVFFTNTAEELSDAAKAYDAAATQYQQSLVALQAGQAIVGQHNAVDGSAVAKGAVDGATAGAVVGSVVPVIGTVIGAVGGAIVGGLVGLFGGKKKEDTLAPLLATYPQLIDANGKFNESLAKTLVANNQVSDATKTLLNNTIAYYDEEQSALDQITSALQDLVGQLGTQISDSLVQAFENGQDAAKAFGTTVSQVLSNIVQQDLFEAIFGPQLTALQQKLTADSLANDGNTSSEIIADIENFYKTAGPLVTQFTQGIQAAQAAGASQGLTLFPPTSGNTSASTLSGGIQSSITENTADILAGSLNGIQLNTLTTNNILSGHSLTFGQLLSIAQDQLTAVLAIQVNTKRTADNSDLMTAALDAIAQNTKSSIGDQLRAAGKLGF